MAVYPSVIGVREQCAGRPSRVTRRRARAAARRAARPRVAPAAPRFLCLLCGLASFVCGTAHTDDVNPHKSVGSGRAQDPSGVRAGPSGASGGVRGGRAGCTTARTPTRSSVWGCAAQPGVKRPAYLWPGRPISCSPCAIRSASSLPGTTLPRSERPAVSLNVSTETKPIKPATAR